MRIRQYATFEIFSGALTHSDITGRLGVEPDAFRVQGSRIAEPPAPRHHSWGIASKAPGLAVDEHLRVIVDRLSPHSGAIGALVEEIETTELGVPGVGSVLAVVRHLDDDDGEEEQLSVIERPDGSRLEKLSGQHQLLGWRFTPDIIEFLIATRSILDIDEYG
jgi:uncharacterized protein DUF4279